ncbi:DUF6101 family protein [Hongsoonwoonella zoysiae]|uniref:DUF6101 family protein n=1 Tax=Hongsoonwoonella zoysiae TaxID=2821844 RepID=UPI001AEEB8A6|nr:DUF6101 family protein [Hongsoonwoonella zoysiae]
MRRQAALQDATDPGSSLVEGLDPHRLPHRFIARNEPLSRSSEKFPFEVYIDHETVVMKHRLAGLPLTVVLPMTAFNGVYARVMPGKSGETLTVSIGLHHRDPALCIELLSSESLEAAALCWRDWADVLSLPLVAVEPDGSVETVEEAGVSKNTQRPVIRRRVAALTNRRPRFLVRRKPGNRMHRPAVFAGEREIIARN